ncbi:MAG: insulinase family protein [Acidimicrobiales bacterium]
MRTPSLRFVSVALAATLVAAACADSPEADELVDGVSGDTPSSVTTTLDDGAGPASDDPTGTLTPPATPPEPDPTPLPIDEDYRIGTLDNGLTYLLRSNDTPGASLDLRLVVNAGSLQQDTPDDGSAHFLEHMLFNGTEAFPGNELTTQLQRLGISFGADVNAYTSYDETVYLLAATTTEPTAPDIAFDVLAEWASNATIDPADVESEIGIVRDELRQGRETVEGFTFTRFEEIYTEGTPYEGRIVVGDAALVEATDAATLRAFYETWYRPDNMAVVVVGDLPLDEMEREVTSRLSGLTNPPTPLERIDVDIPLDPEPIANIIVHPDNGADNLSLDIPLPVWDTGTVGGERMTLIESAVAIMLSTRLQEAFQRGDLDLDREPSISAFSVNRGLRYYGTNLQAPELDVALDSYLSHLLLAAQTGFSDEDVERVKQLLLSDLDDELASLNSTQDWQYAGELSAHFLEGAAADDAERRISRQRAVVESFGSEELTNHWRWILEESGPIVIAVGDDETDLPTPERLLDVLDSVIPAGATEAAQVIDQLMLAPERAPLQSESSRDTFNGPVAEWTFANGVVVSHQESKISEGNVFVAMASTGGWSALAEPDASLATAAVDAVLGSGVGPHDPATLERYLESRSTSLVATIDEWSETIGGSSSSADVEDLFALINLTITEPRVDEISLRSVSRAATTTLELAETNPDIRAGEVLSNLLYPDDDRYQFLHTAEEIAELDADELLGVFDDRFGEADDLHVAIVGDIGADEAFELAARYLGTLPVGEADTWVDLGVRLPTTAVSGDVVLTAGTADGGLQRVDWVIGQPSARDEVTGALLATIATSRTLETIREALGASYGASVSVTADREGPGALTSFATVSGDPARRDEIEIAFQEILTDLSETGPTADEFDRAVAVAATDYEFVNNGIFLDGNLAATRFPDVDVLQSDQRFAILESLSPDDIRTMAAALYGDAASVTVSKVLP